MELTLVDHTPEDRTVALRSDVFPANVTFSFATHNYPKVRSIVTADEIIVLVDGAYAPAVLYRGYLEDVVGNQAQVVATTSDGEITISRAQGCGCGSRLRSYRPFTQTMALAR